MSNTKSGIIEIAERMGLKAYTENGRIKIEADKAGEILKVWASVGADCVKTHDGTESRSWTIHLGGVYVAALLENKNTGFAYSFTAAV